MRRRMLREFHVFAFGSQINYALGRGVVGTSRKLQFPSERRYEL